MKVDTFSDWAITIHVAINEEEIMMELDSLEEQEKFSEFSYLYSSNRLFSNDNFDHYYKVNRATDEYFFALTTLVQWDEIIELSKSEETELEKSVENLTQSITYLSTVSHQDEYDDDSMFSTTHLASIYKMQDNILALLQQYFILDEETVNDFWTLTPREMETKLLEGVIENV